MKITPEWAAVALSCAVALGGLIGWWLKDRRERRNASPAVLWDGRRLQVKNRLSEHLLVSKARCRSGSFHRGEYAFDDGGSLIPGSVVTYASPLDLDWSVPPSGDASFTISIVNGPTEMELTISSSARTLRDRRIIVKAFAKD